MSFFNKIKSAFGFDGESYDEDDLSVENESATHFTEQPAAAAEPAAADIEKSPDTTARAEASDSQSQRQASPEETADVAADLFDGVIAVFNSALPDFLSHSINTEQQRLELIRQLDERLRRRIVALGDRAKADASQALSSERNRLSADLKSLRDRNRLLDERQNETNAARLSAERQKRALQERVHDLESQVARLEAEKEQFELETKSMMSRMRAAGVSLTGEATLDQPADEESAARIEELTKTIADKDSELAASRDRIAENEKALHQLQKENKELNDGIEQLRTKQTVADSLVNSLQSKAAEERSKADESSAECNRLREQAGRLEEENRQLTERIDSLLAKADERDAAEQTAMAEIERQVSNFERVRERLDNRIAELKAENALLRQSVAEVQSAADRQPEAAPTAPAAPVIADSAADYAADLTEAPQADKPESSASGQHSAKRGRKKKHQPKITAIDEYMDNNDWFGSPMTSDDDTADSQRSESSTGADDDFGYKQPQRRPAPTDSSQLSLW